MNLFSKKRIEVVGKVRYYGKQDSSTSSNCRLGPDCTKEITLYTLYNSHRNKKG